MAAIDQHVVVNITKATARLTRVGFGVPLILGVNNKFAERVREYSNITAVAVDFAVTDEEWRIANLLFSQQLGPEKIKIGRREVSAAQDQVVTVAVVADDTVYDLIVNGQKFSFTSGVATTAILIAAGLKVLYDAGFVGDPTFTDNLNGTYNITAATAAIGFSIETDGGQTIGSNTNTNTIASELNAVIAEDDDWYFLLTTKIGNQADRTADIEATATAIEALLKQFHYSDGNTDALAAGSSNAFNTLKSLSRERSYGKWAVQWYDYPEAALLGLQAPKDPGSTNWANQVIAGALAQVFTDTQRTNLLSLNANFNEEIGGLNIESSPATMGSGEFIDNVRGDDLTQVRIAEDVFIHLVQTEKVFYTNKGIQSVVTIVRARLLILANQGLFTEESIVVTAPDVADVDANDKANRILRDVKFSVTRQGAINKVIIDGTVSV